MFFLPTYCCCHSNTLQRLFLTCRLLQKQPQHEQLPQLPAGILQQVLSYVPLHHRLGSCSPASRSMHAAAVAATDDIYLPNLNSQQKASELCQWLDRYGSQVLRHLDVGAYMTVALPSGLQQLQSWALWSVEQQSWALWSVLSCLLRLTPSRFLSSLDRD
jgi:hypothetical protein